MLALALCLSLLPTTAVATSTVAKVTANGSTNSYSDINTAWSAATKAGSATVELCGSSTLTMPLVISSDQDITLTGTGTIICSLGRPAIRVDGGKLTVPANASFTVSHTYGSSALQINGGEVTIAGGTFTGSKDGENTIEITGGTVSISGGTFSATGSSGPSITAGTVTAYVEYTIAKTTVRALDRTANVNDTAPDLRSPVLDTDYTVTGLVGTDALNGTLTLTYDSDPDMTKAGTYTITPAGVTVSGNYILGFQTGTLTVSAKASGNSGSIGSPAATQTDLTFTDADQVSAYAKEALLWASETGILSDKGNGILDPKGTATRAEVAQMLINTMG
jgi:hypothetical protein